MIHSPVRRHTVDELLMNMALAVLFTAVKNPKRVAAMKAALRKLRTALIALNLD